MLFVKNNRYEKTIKIIENLKNKTIVIYSSNFKRLYLNSKAGQVNDMEKLCLEGTSSMKSGGLDSAYLKISEGNQDPYTLSFIYLKENLDKKKKYILIDINRGQTRHGEKYDIGGISLCPITITISKKSKSYDDSLLFMGRVKAVIDKKYNLLPVHIVTDDTLEYNQSMGYIAALIELGDASNTYEQAKESLNILCQAIKEVVYGEDHQP